ncbi:ATP-binding protein [Iningainema tapete]|uniref:Circadian input-output histidine kinase CikA n=1 Tax=Iningainema tapete BLCC-T55 TaxID=2748662 RepID=A0A8J6XNQ3_9CYAN|nr:ATP-binding protein [Iningainema tapete]MBD2778463.1 response regulator [Iningainema tapete BLCC-T55]
MNLKNFAQTIEALRERFASGQKRTEESPLVQQLLTEAFSKLSIALEELEIAQEELAIQNEELVELNQELTIQNQELDIARQIALAEHQRYQDLFEQAPDGYLVTDTQGKIQQANRAAATLLNTYHLVERSLLAFVVEKERLAFETELTQPRTGDWIREWDVRLQPHNRKPIDVAVTVAAVRDGEGKLFGLRWLLRDITERKLAEVEKQRLYRKAQEANRVKDEFLAIVSHELRTPLNSILGWTRMLRNQNLNAVTAAKALETIERNAKLQGKLIDDILDISRIVQGQIHLNMCPLDLIPVISAVIENIHPIAQTKAIEVKCIIDPMKGQVMADAERLQQIVWNLLLNAVKFTPTGGYVEVRLEQIDLTAQITISDTGKGISPEFLPYVFEPFRQADATTTRSHDGLGLGLSIVQHLVEMHNGKVSAASAGVGLGATFTVELPMIDSPQQQAISNREVSFSNHQVLNGLQILVVDDNIDTCELITFILEECGAQVTAVLSVSEAIDVLSRFKPDVLISDIGMPVQDGYSLIDFVKRMEAERKWIIPAVALTAFATDEEVSRAIAAGFQMHVPKPVEPSDLVTVVANLAKRKG